MIVKIVIRVGSSVRLFRKCCPPLPECSPMPGSTATEAYIKRLEESLVTKDTELAEMKRVMEILRGDHPWSLGRMSLANEPAHVMPSLWYVLRHHAWSFPRIARFASRLATKNGNLFAFGTLLICAGMTIFEEVMKHRLIVLILGILLYLILLAANAAGACRDRFRRARAIMLVHELGHAFGIARAQRALAA